MHKRLVKIVVFTVTLLTANLLSTWVGDLMTGWKNEFHPLLFTGLTMALIAFVLYPFFEFINRLLAAISKFLLEEGKSLAGPFVGLALVFLASLVVLYFFYFRLWYDENLVQWLYRNYLADFFRSLAS